MMYHTTFNKSERGSTLIELIVSMSVGVIILAGIAVVFAAETKSSTALESRTEAMSDLYITSQVIKKALRSSSVVTIPSSPVDLQANGRATMLINGTLLFNKTVILPPNYPTSIPSLPYYDANTKTLTYKNGGGVIGIFMFQSPLIQDRDKIFWLRPDITEDTFQEMVRGMDIISGMNVVYSNGIWEVVLNKKYKNESSVLANMALKFKVWSRNR